jgi:hypothetical protein
MEIGHSNSQKKNPSYSGNITETEVLVWSGCGSVPEVRRMGADIKLEGKVAIIKGNRQWQAAVVEASDVRDGAALILAGVFAPGKTLIGGLEHLDRGYEKFTPNSEILSGSGKDITLADHHQPFIVCFIIYQISAIICFVNTRLEWLERKVSESKKICF